MWVSGILSAICFSLMSLTIAHFGSEFTASEILLGRSVVGLIVLFPFMIKPLRDFTPTPTLIIRGVVGTSSIIIFLYMIQNIGAGSASAIHYTSPVYVTLLSWIFLKDRISVQKIVALCLVVSGIAIQLLQAYDALTVGFVMIGCLGALLSGISFFLLKIMSNDTSEIVVYWFFCAIQFLIQLPLSSLNSLPLLEIRYSRLAQTGVTPCIVIGLFACAAQILMNKSFKKLPAATASLLNLLSVPITVLIERYVFSVQYPLSKFIMISLMILGIVILRLSREEMNGELFSVSKI